MNQVFLHIQKEGKGLIYGLFGDEFFHAAFEDFTGSPAAIKEAIENGADPATQLSDVKKFPLRELTEIRVYQGWTHMDVRHRDTDGKSGEETLYFGTDQLDELGRELATATGMPFRDTERAAGVFSLLTFPGLVLAIGGFIVGLLYMTAVGLEAGDEVKIRGRHALLKWLFVTIASVIGSTGCLILAGLLIFICFAWIAKNIMFWPQNRHFEFPQA